ncbi:MAG: Imidazole glycerol phosphate synthase subunit HisH [Elusimicrobia bacterium]|nr:Imidazole glycerol phosphate synthase subunit HisH [Elusimicrobiota bacterium]
MQPSKPVAIIDYGLGNLYSIKRACEHVGLESKLTSDKSEILNAAAVILPGVGAFGDAMNNLAKLDLVSVLRDVCASGTPLFGICLGLQLLMRESHEFGHHKGLCLIDGDVVKIPAEMTVGKRYKVPQVGWNQVNVPLGGREWKGTLLEGISPGGYFYFVHSYYVRPTDPGVILSSTTYGSTSFCSSVQFGNVFAVQFHPERSGPLGLLLYSNLNKIIASSVSKEKSDVIHNRP